MITNVIQREICKMIKGRRSQFADPAPITGTDTVSVPRTSAPQGRLAAQKKISQFRENVCALDDRFPLANS
jgi:uncharacterized protein YcbX